MTTIDEQVQRLIPSVMRIAGESGGVGLTELLRNALLEVDKDQRHACAEAIAGMLPTGKTIVQGCVLKDEAHQAVMNADLK